MNCSTIFFKYLGVIVVPLFVSCASFYAAARLGVACSTEAAVIHNHHRDTLVTRSAENSGNNSEEAIREKWSGLGTCPVSGFQEIDRLFRSKRVEYRSLVRFGMVTVSVELNELKKAERAIRQHALKLRFVFSDHVRQEIALIGYCNKLQHNALKGYLDKHNVILYPAFYMSTESIYVRSGDRNKAVSLLKSARSRLKITVSDQFK
jgi:hypothetical protein